jgi:para-aminobenzoate synthetase component 1
MKQLLIEELEYTTDSTTLFSAFLDWEHPIFLDSSAPQSLRGRYDIFSARPVATIKSQHHNTKKSDINFFEKVKRAIKQHTPDVNNAYHLPFTGGAMGYFGYDLGRQLEHIPSKARNKIHNEEAVVGIYTWAVIVDHRQHRTLLVCHPAANDNLIDNVRLKLRKAKDSLATDNDTAQQTKNKFQLKSHFQTSQSKNDYRKSFETIQTYIRAGDCYQVNLAQHFSADFTGSAWDAYLALRKTAAAPFSAFIGNGSSSILSLSPERLIQSNKHRVTTSPIKGTIARGKTQEKDEQLAQQLINSEKDRAENLMIVDLLRNDLGKSCIPGSIQVDQLFELQSFETVHHLVSTISGQLKPDMHALDVLASCFPGGSITGAPKLRAMEIIEELEPYRRNAYCGAIGYISCDGQMDTNIAIRTMICEEKTIHCWAGGGIVADSEADKEYEECFTKVEKLFAAIENR